MESAASASRPTARLAGKPRTGTTHGQLAIAAAAAFALMSLQLAFVRLAPWEVAVRIVLPATMAAVPVALWPYRRHLGVWMIYVGLAANLAAILANGGLMPIRRSTVEAAIGAGRAAEYQTGDWIRGSKDVLVEHRRATAIGDRIVIRIGGGGLVASPGDVVVWAGVVALGVEAAWVWRAGARGRGNDGATPALQEASDGPEGQREARPLLSDAPPRRHRKRAIARANPSRHSRSNDLTSGL